jgi:hypothetical protein
MTTPNDAAEPSLASAGSHWEPVGWQATDEFGRPSGFLSWRCGETRWPKSQTVPVYLQPQPTLTDEDLDWIGEAANDAEAEAESARRNGLEFGGCERQAKALRAIVERFK